MTNPDVTAAAERLRRQQMSGGGFVTTDEDQWTRDVCALADAYLATVAADDGEPLALRELLSRLRDIERRIGVACHPDWIRGQLDSLIRHYERSLLTSGREARVNE